QAATARRWPIVRSTWNRPAAAALAFTCTTRSMRSITPPTPWQQSLQVAASARRVRVGCGLGGERHYQLFEPTSGASLVLGQQRTENAAKFAYQVRARRASF